LGGRYISFLKNLKTWRFIKVTSIGQKTLFTHVLKSMVFVLSTISLFVFPIFSPSIFANRTLGLEDWQRTEDYYKDCLNLKKLVIKNQYQVECFTNYHHFNSNAVSKYYNESNSTGKFVEIGAFNLWHPGAGSTPYKDYEIVAKIINGHDLVSAMELLPVISSDQENNERVAKFVEEIQQKLTDSSLNSEQVTKLQATLSKAMDLYRSPGYLKVLDELRLLYPSWSLILAPSGEAADEKYTQELVGFFYRGSKVKPIVNEHCDRFKKKSHGVSYACYPKLTKDWFGKSIREVFSRRPFLGSFKAGRFDFSILTSHIVFNTPADAGGMQRVLMPSFGVSDYREIGPGANKANFARLAEMKIILEIMNKIREESREKDIIFLGDTNLESSNLQWDNILKSFPGGKVFVDEPTTLSPKRFLSDGSETNGVANDYDHIILDTSETSECLKSNGSLSPRVGNFLQGRIRSLIDKNYRYRLKGTNMIDSTQERARDKKVSQFFNKLKSTLTIKRGEITVEETNIKGEVENFDSRVFKQQLLDDSYYRYFREVISDHFPIYFSCKG